MRDAERFITKFVVNRNSGCWEWQANFTRDGYGRFFISVPGRRLVRAHRYSYEFFRHQLAAGYVLDHLCANRKCVNPAHLNPCTASEHMSVEASRGNHPNAKKTHCKRGHPFSGENLAFTPDGRRRCRACYRLHGLNRDRRRAGLPNLSHLP